MNYNELVELLKQKQDELDIIRVKKSSDDTRKQQTLQRLESMDNDKEERLFKDKEYQLQQLIREVSLVYENTLAELDSKREKLTENREKKVAKIDYETYYKKYGNKDTRQLEEKCKEIRNVLNEKQGVRLSTSLARVYPTGNYSNQTLESMYSKFDEVDVLLKYVSRNSSLMDTFTQGITSFEFDKLTGNSAHIAIAILIVVILLFIFKLSSILVMVLVPIMGYEIYKSYMFHKCHKIINTIEPNVDKIKESIESGVRNKMKADIDAIDVGYHAKMRKIEDRYAQVEQKLQNEIDTTSNEFVYNRLPISESYDLQKKTIIGEINNLTQSISNLEKTISDLGMEISGIQDNIIKESSRIKSVYYPSGSFDAKSLMVPEDFLFDVIDNKPVIHKMPRGSALYVFKNRDDLNNFVTLFLSTLYSRVKLSSFTITYYDNVYMGRPHNRFNCLDNFEIFTELSSFVGNVNELPSDIKRRDGIRGNSHMYDYNKAIIADDGSPLTVRYFLDLNYDKGVFTEKAKQVVRNGFPAGVSWMSFLTLADISENVVDIIELLDYFEEFYQVGPSSYDRKSRKFMKDSLLKMK